jgi:hypothetical protein
MPYPCVARRLADEVEQLRRGEGPHVCRASEVLGFLLADARARLGEIRALLDAEGGFFYRDVAAILDRPATAGPPPAGGVNAPQSAMDGQDDPDGVGPTAPDGPSRTSAAGGTNPEDRDAR